MKVYIDTSSLLKLYHEEKNSDYFTEFLIKEDIESIYLSELAKVEFISAIWKKIRAKEITDEQGKKVIEVFLGDKNKYEWIEINQNIIENSMDMIKKYGKKGLRSLDSLQLSTALYIKNNIDSKIVCLSSDSLLKEFLNKEKLKIR